MALGGVGGALLGAELAKKMDNKAVEKLLLALMLMIILLNIYNAGAYGMVALEMR